ncbi:MAG TPA: FapA family protein [Clostridia bacterium]|nr:FapA family protein [Clostridia bacterium]
MAANIIYKDEYLAIAAENSDILVESYKKGFPMDKVSSILVSHPEIAITSLSVLRSSIMSAPAKSQKIGELKERLHLEVTPAGLTATITFNVPQDDLNFPDKLKPEILKILEQNGIIYGISLDFLRKELKPGVPYTVAQGLPAEDGTDARITMYELREARPEIRKDGKVDYYEMQLINRVKPGDWLGERLEATDGTRGKTVRGEEIKPVKGKTAALNYDRNSVAEVSTEGKTTLYSRLSGAVNYTGGRISVSNHLEINGDVGVSTGNIKFDGYLTVKGTILDGFYVEATRDIEINSDLGLGKIKGLVSTNGSIYIKGGISARERVEVRAAKNVFVKFADNALIVCGETAHIGYYSLNCDICAKDVIYDSSNGQVIGGYIKSEIHVTVPICGSDMERKTTIEVTGFNRQALVTRLDEVFHEIGIKKAEQQKLKQSGTDSGNGGKDPENVSDKIYLMKEEIKSLEEERKYIAGYLKAKGDGEIAITRHLFPNCAIILGGSSAEYPSDTVAATFYLKDGEIRQI